MVKEKCSLHGYGAKDRKKKGLEFYNSRELPLRAHLPKSNDLPTLPVKGSATSQ
jgi:hypothetical protein